MTAPPLPSIRGRLSRTLVAFALGSGIAIAAAVGFAVHHEVDEIMDATLRESAQILHGLLSYHLDHLPLAPDGPGGAMPAPPHKEDLVWQIVAPGPRVLLRSHDAPDQALADAGTQGFADVGPHWRVHAAPLGTPGQTLLVAQPVRERHEAQIEAVQYSAGAALLAGLLCALWLRTRLRRELLPITDLSAAVARFDPLEPSSALPPARRQELLPVHAAITDLGTRLARRLANERAFSAHAAHALRTPLAGMVVQLATAQRLAPEPAQAPLARARQAADRLGRVVNALLALFRTGTELHRQHVRLAELAEPLGGVLALDIDACEPLWADPDLLAAALANLLDNSVRHGATRAALGARRQGPLTLITLHDNGPGLDEARRLQLQAALDAQRYEGATGMGLMLADLVARAHGGQVQLMPSDAGCRVALALEAPPHTPPMVRDLLAQPASPPLSGTHHA